MRLLVPVLALLVMPLARATAPEPLSADALKARVAEITRAQNAVMMRGSTVEDVDRLFALYTDDFTYVHEAYGGTYTREALYGNTVRLLERGVYARTDPRYVLVSTIPGHASIAVEREEVHEGVVARHLAVFEFEGDKVSRIIEYWK